MILNRVLIFIALSTLLQYPIANAAETPTKRPNVLLILADDLGYADLNINTPSAHSPTPHLNTLAEQGIRFTRHYTESTCSPSRAALLTGSYPSRINFKPDGLGIPTELDTLPKTLKAAGYRTHQIGKWHLGHLIPEAWPDAQGFDTWLGFLNQWLMTNSDRLDGFHYGSSTHLNPYLQNERGEIKQFQGHLTDISTDETIRLIKNEKAAQPWFIYLAYFAPHEPMEPRADYAARFPDTLAGRYAALVSHMDDRVGDILKALDETGQSKNTIVVFASDNGGTNAYLDNNAPLKGRKTEYLEGGVRTPLLISWPGKILPNHDTNEVVSIMDIYPSLATLTGIQPPKNLDGRSLFSQQGELKKLTPRPLYWDTAMNLARKYGVLSADGRWRLYQDFLGSPSLYDLSSDPISSVNVADKHPDIVARLHANYENWEAAVAHIHLHTQYRDSDGHRVLVGDQLQRAITFADFTVAIGLTPKKVTTEEQVIIEQKSLLRLTQSASGLHIRFHGLNTDLPTLPTDQCSSLILTGTLNRNISLFKLATSTLNIYINGHIAKSITQEMPLMDSTNIQQVTYIGMSEDATHRFDGTLSEPIYLNRRADADVAKSISTGALSKHLCTTNVR